MIKPPILFTSLLILTGSGTHGFLQRNQHHPFGVHQHRSNELNVPLSHAEASSHCRLPSPTKTALSDTLTAGVFDPLIEAELCTTMAHVALDFTSIVSPSRSIMRLFAVIGRVFAISADYLPDHSIHTEELMIQIFLLSLALRELVSDKIGEQLTAASGNATTSSSTSSLKSNTTK